MHCILSTVPFLMWMTRSAIAVSAELCVMTMTVRCRLTSSSTKCISVTDDQTLRAVKTGRAKITCVSEDNEKSPKATVNRFFKEL